MYTDLFTSSRQKILYISATKISQEKVLMRKKTKLANFFIYYIEIYYF